MAESHFLSALKQRRAECLGELDTLRKSIAELETQENTSVQRLANIDGLLRFEDPNLVLDEIRPRKARSSRSGSDEENRGRVPLTKAIMRTLRTRKQAMSAREVFQELAAEYAEADETKLLRSIATFLSTKKKAGMLCAAANEGDVTRYGIAA